MLKKIFIKKKLNIKITYKIDFISYKKAYD